MLRTLRSRLIFSHILPLLIIIPLLNLALVYLLETRVLLPQLTKELVEDARILTRSMEVLPGQTEQLTVIVSRYDLNQSMRLVYLAPDGTVLHTNDPNLLEYLGRQLVISGFERARSGQEVILTNYSFLRRENDFIQVLFPVSNSSQQIVGVLWVTYLASWLSDLFNQLRSLSIMIVLIALALGIGLGSVLALNISKPVGQVTAAIYRLARGEQNENIREQGPEEVRDLARAINFLVERLHTLEQARRQLLANLVHELGRPLGALRSAIQALAKGASEDPAFFIELTDGMDAEAARMQHIVEDLAHLHDQVLGPLELNLEPIQVGQWLPSMLAPWSEAAAAKGLSWRETLPANLPLIQADTLRLSQVIGNLVSNAIRYTPAGGTVHIEAGQEGDHVWIRIRDSGVGIAREEQELIFQPFYRGDQGRRIKQGMGLGLSIARDLAKAHGGRLAVESTPAAGSAFTLWLPVS